MMIIDRSYYIFVKKKFVKVNFVMWNFWQMYGLKFINILK